MASRSPDSDPARRAWPSGDVLRVAALLVLLYVVLQLLWEVSSVLLLGFLGVLFGLALSAGVDRLQRLRVPRPIGAAAIVLLVGGLLFGLGRLVAPTVAKQGREVGRRLPELFERGRDWLESRQGGVVGLFTEGGDTTAQQPAPAPVEQAPSSPMMRQLVGNLGAVGRRFFAVFSSTLAALGGLLLVLFIAIYIAVDPAVYRRGIMHLIPRPARPRARQVLDRVAFMLRRWLLSQAIAMMAVGALTAVLLVLLGVDGAIALGVIAGLLEFIPIAGPVIAAIPGIGMALLDGVDKALYVTLAYVAVQQAEAQLITPIVMKEGMELPPVLTILGQATMAVVFGFIGLVVAVPLLGALFVAVNMLYVKGVVGDDVPLPGDDSS